MSLIERLTPEQTARLGEFRDLWTDIGLSTRPANRKLAEDATARMYVAAGLSPPRMVWCGSPLAQVIACAIARGVLVDALDYALDCVLGGVSGEAWNSARNGVLDSVPGDGLDDVRDRVWESVGVPVRGAVEVNVFDTVRTSVWEGVYDSVWVGARYGVWSNFFKSVLDNMPASVPASAGGGALDSMREEVLCGVWCSAWDMVRDSVGVSVWDSVRVGVQDGVLGSGLGGVLAGVLEGVRNSARRSVFAGAVGGVAESWYGQHDAGWLSFYSFFREACGLCERTERLLPVMDYAKSAGWSLPCRGVCWMSERHNVLLRDDRGLLHNLVGPAVQYPDGWSIYAIHGVRVPGYIIERPAEISVSKIDGEGDAEIRRVMIDRYGQTRYLLDSGARLVQADDFGTLYRKEIDGDEPLVMVKVVNSTRESDGTYKDYFLRVPPDVQTAKQAVAWTFGVGGDEYNPEVQT